MSVAAIPSLHAALPMLVAVVLWGRRRWLNVVLACYPLAMAWTLVYAGEHFMFDILVGWTYAIAIGLVAVRYRSASSVPAESPVAVPQAAASGVAGS